MDAKTKKPHSGGRKPLTVEDHRQRADRLRALIAAGHTIKTAAAEMGLSPAQLYKSAVIFKIRAGRRKAAQARRQAGQAGGLALARKRGLNIALPTPASPDYADRAADKERALQHAQRMRAARPQSEQELAALIAEHIARRGVTVCPPAAAEVTFGNGTGFAAPPPNGGL